MKKNEEIVQIWRYDLLDRRKDAEFLIEFIERRLNERGDAHFPRNYVLNIDAAWGFGKTFFMGNLQKHLSASGRICAYVNAWEDDHADDPMIAVMSEINRTIKPYLKNKSQARRLWNGITKNAGRIAIEFGKGASKGAIRKASGEAFDEISDLIHESEALSEGFENVSEEVDRIIDSYAERLLKEFEKTKDSIDKFKGNLENFIRLINSDSSNYPFYIIVDELDRCCPSYAISLLERVKHIFDIENVVFIFATDTLQLQHAISAIYGSKFDGSRYLQRFFDRTYLFEEPGVTPFVKKLFHAYRIDIDKLSAPTNDVVGYFSDTVQYCGIGLRDIERCFDILRSCLKMWDKDIELNLVYLLPLILAYGLKDHKGFDRLIKLDNSYPTDSMFNNEHKIELLVRDEHGAKRQFAKNATVISDVLSVLKMPLMEARESRFVCVAQMFQSEFQRIHNSRFTPGGPRVDSLMLSYPKLVRGSAQFSDPDSS